MFIHQSRLEHVLRPSHYIDDGHHAQEIERLFLPAWHLLATRAELPRPGNFASVELLGRPILVRNIDGEIHAFLNVCAHRHCRLTRESAGYEPRFRCQYHGWEYAQDGRTARIPDASCFRPFDRENARLHKFRVSTVGDLGFVALTEQAPSLEQYLGAYYPICAEAFAAPYVFAAAWEYDLPCNWKIPIENTLEGYHIPCLHPKTFKEHATEEESEHRLEESSTSLCTPVPPTLARVILDFLVRRLGFAPKQLYQHHHVHPNLVFIRMDVLRIIQIAIPTSANRCRFRILLYTLRGKAPGPVAFMLGRLLRRLSITAVRRVVEEDVAIFGEVQRGMQASVHPGAIGTLEERVYVFQKWVQDRCEASA